MSERITKVTISIECKICGAEAEAGSMLTPPGWSADDSQRIDGFCPEHQSVEAFLDDQCPGCVSSFSDCVLREVVDERVIRAQAGGSHQYNLTDDQLVMLRAGRCPVRINGTNCVGSGGSSQTDLSTPNARGGSALASFLEARQ